SGWKDYQRTGEVCGHKLPAGLRESEKLSELIFTPATKAETGHDENISEEQMAGIVGRDVMETLRDISLQVYREASDYARGRGIIIADTKFEFGRDRDGAITLIDEVLTPDSSRFWPAASYEVGKSQASFDKQYVRDYLESVHWNKQPPCPELPPEIAQATTARYLEAYELITGESL
ncbi:MAG TPA: phosphoribosylaminoimidazolesuccinocarboxamide synthase, partial [Pyrinomonadaceae bacterium]|nr:phosphoribosylaminoimidazolesuccinocarboxamide synthase [Pyrinomonadaceae bacterium]